MSDPRMIVKPGLVQLPIFLCLECQAVLCGQDSRQKHKCNKGDQNGELEKESLENLCSGNKEGKRQVELPVSRMVNDELPERLEQVNEKFFDASGIQTGLKKVAVASTSRPQVLEEPKTGTSASVVVGSGIATTSSSRTGLPENTVKMESVEEILPGTTEADYEEVIYYDCKICNQEFRRLQVLKGHLQMIHNVGREQASAIVMALRKSEVDNDEYGPPSLSYYGGQDWDQGLGADVKHLYDFVASKRIERIRHKPSTDDSNEVDRENRSRSPSVEILGFYRPAKADGRNQGSTSKIDSALCKSRLQKLSNETGSPDEEAMDVGDCGISDQGRSSAVRSSNRMQPPSNGTSSCKWCTKSFARNCDLTGHIRCHHPEQTIVQCTQCKFKTAESLMEEHMSNRHGIKRVQRAMASTSKAFLISQPQALPSRRGISLPHHNAARGGGVLCSEQELNNFSKSVAGRASAGGTKKGISSRSKKNHQCDECPQAFHRRLNLEDHKAATHTGEGPYICPGCGRQDWCRYNMKSHMTRACRIDNVPATRAAMYPSHL